MRKTISTLAVMLAAVVSANALQANLTLFDLAKDSQYIVRGEFTGLERTVNGDRLSLRCDEAIRGDLPVGETVTLEAFERAPADEALGREVIVCYYVVKGQNLFLYHPFAVRSFMFEDFDVAPNGLDQNEQALRNFMEINSYHQAEIAAELLKRGEYQALAYEGEYEQPLIDEWKAELLKQLTWSGTRAAFDASKALCEHDLFRGQLTVEEVQIIGAHVAMSAPGTLERSYQIELIRNEVSAHPDFNTQIMMMREETSQACVGKLSNLMNSIEDKLMVIERVGTIAIDRNESAQTRINALQILQALKNTDGLPYVHQALLGELESEDTNKDVMRRGFTALRWIPHVDSIPVLDTLLASSYVSESWELTQRAWIAYSMIDTTVTNNKLRTQYNQAETQGMKFFFQKLLPENQIIRKLMIVHHED